jgi:hypothetical protein
LTLFTHSAEAGQTSGTTVTTANSATGGDAFTSVVSSMTYDSTNVAHGSMGFKCTAAASTSTYMDWVNISGSSTTLGFALRFYVYIPTLPTASAQPLLYLRRDTSSAGIAPLQLGTTGTGSHLFFTADGNGGATITGSTTTYSLLANTLYRIEVTGSNGTSTTGTLTLDIYLGDSTSPVSGGSISLTGMNWFNTNPIGTVRWGRPAAIGSAFTYYLDDLAFATATTTKIGPATSSQEVDPTSIASTLAIGSPSISTTITLAPNSRTSTLALGSPTISTTITSSPTSIASTLSVGQPSITLTGTVQPASRTSTLAIGSPTISTTITTSPTSIGSTVALGAPSIQQLITYAPDSIAATTAIGAPDVAQQTRVARFVTPYVSHAFQMDGALLAALRYGVTVMRIDGEYVESEWPSNEQLAAATEVYWGGTVCDVTDQQATDLIAAGYTVEAVYEW